MLTKCRFSITIEGIADDKLNLGRLLGVVRLEHMTILFALNGKNLDLITQQNNH